MCQLGVRGLEALQARGVGKDPKRHRPRDRAPVRAGESRPYVACGEDPDSDLLLLILAQAHLQAFGERSRRLRDLDDGRLRPWARESCRHAVSPRIEASHHGPSARISRLSPVRPLLRQLGITDERRRGVSDPVGDDFDPFDVRGSALGCMGPDLRAGAEVDAPDDPLATLPFDFRVDLPFREVGMAGRDAVGSLRKTTDPRGSRPGVTLRLGAPNGLVSFRGAGGQDRHGRVR